MKTSKLKTALAAAVALIAGFADASLVTQSTVKPGVWCTSRTAAVSYAEKNNMPLFLFLGSPDCAYCRKCINEALDTATFKDWQARRQIVFAFIEKSNITADDPDYKWATGGTPNTAAGNLPICRIYWKKANGSVVGRSYSGRAGKVLLANGQKAASALTPQAIINSIESYISSWSFASTLSIPSSGTLQEGVAKTFTISRSGSGSVNATLTISSPSGDVKFVSGTNRLDKLSLTLTGGSASFVVEAPSTADIDSRTATVTLSSTTSGTKFGNKTLSLAVQDRVASAIGSWVSMVEVASGTWDAAENGGPILSPQTGNTPEIKIAAASAGVITVAFPATTPVGTKTLGLDGQTAYLVDADYHVETVGIAQGGVMSLYTAASTISFQAFGAPVVSKPASGAMIAKSDARANKSALDLSWRAVAGAERYIVRVGDVTVTNAADELSVNAYDLGVVTDAVLNDTSASKSYSWSVTAVSPALTLGAATSTAAATFTLAVKPQFSSSVVSSATVYQRIGNTISVAATGAPGITYSLARGSSLPSGLVLNAATGVISGTPRRNGGTTRVTVVASSSNGQASSKTISITAAKFPVALKGNWIGQNVNGSGLATAGYLVKISASGKVTCTKTASSGGTAKLSGTIACDYTSGAGRYVLTLDGTKWTYAANAFSAGTARKVVKQNANGALNSYSTVAVYNGARMYGYLSVKVTGGKKARVAGYVNGKKVSKSVNLAVSGSTATAFFAVGGVYGSVNVRAGAGAGASPSKVAAGGTVCTASGKIFPSNVNVSSLNGARLTVGSRSLPVSVASSGKLAVAKNNAYSAKLTYNAKSGVFKGTFAGVKFYGAMAYVNGAWIGCGTAENGQEVKISK